LRNEIEYKTTNSHFKLFRKEVQKWINILGLYGWEVIIEHDEFVPDSLGSIKALVEPRCCSIGLSPIWSENPTDIAIKKTAFHEVMELLLIRISTIAEERFIKQREINEEAHNIIRTMENVLFPKY